MHEVQGGFCKTGNSLDNAKFAELKKNIYGPNLAGPTGAGALEAHHGLLARSVEEAGWAVEAAGPGAGGAAVNAGERARGARPLLDAELRCRGCRRTGVAQDGGASRRGLEQRGRRQRQGWCRISGSLIPSGASVNCKEAAMAGKIHRGATGKGENIGGRRSGGGDLLVLLACGTTARAEQGGDVGDEMEVGDGLMQGHLLSMPAARCKARGRKNSRSRWSRAR